MSEIDKAEYHKLSEIVAAAEKATTQGEPSGLIANLVMNVKQRMDVLETKIDGLHGYDKKEKTAQTDTMIVAMVERETRLNATEQQAYSEFLEKEYFTRDDIDGLESFYADSGAWDRLSNGGKAEMSKRLWEGIARGELSFGELGVSTQKKEADYLYQQFTNPAQAPEHINKFSKEARENFIRAYEAGNHAKTQEILSGEGLFEYQLVDTQPASGRSPEAAAPGAANSGKNDSDKISDKKVLDNTINTLSGFSQKPTELNIPPSQESIERI